MKKSVLSLAALALISASSFTASAQSTMGPDAVSGCMPRPQAVSGCMPRPQSVFGGIYSAVVAFFGL